MDKKKIVLIGGGGHCKVVISILNKLDEFEIVGIVDNYKLGSLIKGIKVIGTDDNLRDIYQSGIHYGPLLSGRLHSHSGKEECLCCTAGNKNS